MQPNQLNKHLLKSESADLTKSIQIRFPNFEFS